MPVHLPVLVGASQQAPKSVPVAAPHSFPLPTMAESEWSLVVSKPRVWRRVGSTVCPSSPEAASLLPPTSPDTAVRTNDSSACPSSSEAASLLPPTSPDTAVRTKDSSACSSSLEAASLLPWLLWSMTVLPPSPAVSLSPSSISFDGYGRRSPTCIGPDRACVAKFGVS